MHPSTYNVPSSPTVLSTTLAVLSNAHSHKPFSSHSPSTFPFPHSHESHAPTTIPSANLIVIHKTPVHSFFNYLSNTSPPPFTHFEKLPFIPFSLPITPKAPISPQIITRHTLSPLPHTSHTNLSILLPTIHPPFPHQPLSVLLPPIHPHFPHQSLYILLSPIHPPLSILLPL